MRGAARVGPAGHVGLTGRVGLLVVVSLSVTAAVSGCQKVTKTVAASVSPCFRVLPEAHAAVGGQGRFVDVARIQGRRVTTFPGRPTTTDVTAATSTAVPPGPTATTPTAGRRDVCVVAYRGPFDAARIPHLVGTGQGRYAVVIIGVQTQLVRAVVLTDTLPTPLHAH
jgi:hypothetical protein